MITISAKLHFKYGAVNSGKTSVLMMIAHDYEKRGRKVMVGKPATDIKAGILPLYSRLDSIKRNVDFLILPDSSIVVDDCDIILVDEAQFLNKDRVLDLVDIVVNRNIPVICFGMKVDYTGKPWEGANWLFSYANDIEEIGVRAICDCGSKATMNLRRNNSKPVFDGVSTIIDDNFQAVCLRCYMNLRRKSEMEV